MRNLMSEEKVLDFKSLAISKRANLSLITTVPQAIINQINNMQKSFIWNKKIQKVTNFKQLQRRWFERR